DLHDATLSTAEDRPLAPGQVRMRVDSFSLTANNITYAAFGEAMDYWRFFPAGEEGRGIVPAWGFATVVQSAHPGVAVGERLYGFWPMANSAVLEPGRLDASGFSDVAAHREELHAIYNRYLRCNADPMYTPDTEDMQSLLRPLFTTSWLVDDFLADNGFFGAKLLMLSSASSKTAYGTAFQLMRREDIEVVGLTSAANRAFCETLGCYHRVLAYEELDRLATDAACLYVDFAGSTALRRAIHTRFAGMRYDCSIGGTHVGQLGGGRDLPGPRPTLFFAPAQGKKRAGEWGPQELGRRLAQDWQAFRERVTNPAAPWLRVQRHDGAQAALAAYREVLCGRSDPHLGHVVSMG
ncbi:MAG TPA: DUF2855 family protein, partial [Ramlibacter sp.]|nr:DUF2855 family protein [Ramlibacter sp.]